MAQWLEGSQRTASQPSPPHSFSLVNSSGGLPHPLSKVSQASLGGPLAAAQPSGELGAADTQKPALEQIL